MLALKTLYPKQRLHRVLIINPASLSLPFVIIRMMNDLLYDKTLLVILDNVIIYNI